MYCQFYLVLMFFCFSTCNLFAQTVINVSTSAQLQNALNNAQPGHVIVLAPNNYFQSGGFTIPAGKNGTATNKITLQCNTNATIGSNNLSTGYGLYLQGNKYWIIKNITVYNSKKGIVLDKSSHNIIKDVRVIKTGDEAIHIRAFSSYNIIRNCFIDSTGLVTAGVGEAIYIGSAESNWCTYTNCNPDTSNYNIIIGNSFGNRVISENIDVKEGTVGGIIKNNQFNGAGLDSVNSADSWIDIKGNYYTIICNTGSNTLLDGFQTHINAVGYGNYNTFSDNMLQLSGNANGYGINIKTSNSIGTAASNIVCTNNIVSNAGAGLTNIATTICTSSCSALCPCSN
jgi:hypothetical protein